MEGVRRSNWHLIIVKHKCEHAFLLSLIKLIVFPRELSPIVNALVFARSGNSIASQKSIVAKIIAFYFCNSAVNVEKCAVFANKLIFSDFVASQDQIGIQKLTVEFQDTSRVP